MAKRTKRKKKWIQRAIKEEGALRDYVKQRWGQKAFTEKGTIKLRYLNRIIEDYKRGKVSETTYRRAHLAKTLRKLARKKKKRGGKKK
jgi:hypothetical protein